MRVVETWGEYVRRIAGKMTIAQISNSSGVAQTNVGRWLRGERGQPKPESVIAFARAFNRPAVEALVAAGYISDDEAQIPARTPLSQYSYRELIEELQRRNPED